MSSVITSSAATIADSRPLLKWAGGKTQLLGEILSRIPSRYGRFIEPFFGGGAVFFALRPEHGIIADINPELINLYRSIATEVDRVIALLQLYKNTEEIFYDVRALDWTKLSSAEAAARTIFLNKTCFNGLYRVNKSGQFNVPFGRYKNPRIIDENALRAASLLLSKTKIVCGDYRAVLKENAQAGDVIFLDPPYLPISKYSDFKRYTKESFQEKDHIDLATEVMRLYNLGCHVILTNSNHPLVHDKYKKFSINVIETKRHISCNGKGRTGEDVIVTALQDIKQDSNCSSPSKQSTLYPSTRYMGSKSKLITQLWAVASKFKFETAVDLFSGSGIVGYMLKSQGKTVISNDYMAMATTFAKAMIENNDVMLSPNEATALLKLENPVDNFVETTFKGLYFSDNDNQLIDIIRANIKILKNPYKRAIAMAALIRACLKKRPRGIFTYVGQRYNDGRKDLLLPFHEQFLEAVKTINAAVFSNGKKNRARNGDAMTLQNRGVDLVYIDPPYYSPLSDNEYVRRYHFVEGLARDWEGVEIQENTITKKFKSYPTPFSSREGANGAFDLLFKKFRKSILIVSYSSNSLPTLDEMISIMSKYKNNVEVIPVDYKYSFGNQSHKVGNNKNSVREYIFVGY